jgi:hypothetical protein
MARSPLAGSAIFTGGIIGEGNQPMQDTTELARLRNVIKQLQLVVKHLEVQRNEAHSASIEKAVAADILITARNEEIEKYKAETGRLMAQIEVEIGNNQRLKEQADDLRQQMAFGRQQSQGMPETAGTVTDWTNGNVNG